MKTTFRFLILLLVFSCYLRAGEPATVQGNSSLTVFNGKRFALLHSELPSSLQQKSVEWQKKKSGVKAAMLSALLPGAGEFYAKSYWKAALFFALEVGFWTANSVFNKKGDDEDAKMRRFGEQHWSEDVYWSYVYQKAVDQGLWQGAQLNGYYDSQGRFVVDNLNDDIKRQLYELQDDLGFTHQLPLTRTQQYYEMIYKYLHQFGVGWDDVATTFGTYTYYESPANLHNLTPNISKYRDMRNLSNEFYDRATLMLNLVLLNHLLSAFDAAWTVKKYNLKVSQAVRVFPDYDSVPRLAYGLKFEW